MRFCHHRGVGGIGIAHTRNHQATDPLQAEVSAIAREIVFQETLHDVRRIQFGKERETAGLLEGVS